jgi:hypothetical protein
MNCGPELDSTVLINDEDLTKVAQSKSSDILSSGSFIGVCCVDFIGWLVIADSKYHRKPPTSPLILICFAVGQNVIAAHTN